jgi:uncharacterized protein YbjQ (UPF0145 family)
MRALGKMKILYVAVVGAFLVGCTTSGSALMTGTARPPFQDFTSVAILTEMPDGAEQIAIVKASSADGWNQQQSLDYAVEELKKQAAKVGANAVVIIDRDTTTGVVSGGSTVTSYDTEIVEALAVFVH